MIGILLAGHGNFAEGMLSASKVIAGTLDNADFIGLFHGDSPDAFEENILNKLEALDDGDGVIILTDITGGTPANRSLICMGSRPNVRVISGTNMTMLIECLFSREGANIDELCEKLHLGGKEAVKLLHKELEEALAEDDDDDF